MTIQVHYDCATLCKQDALLGWSPPFKTNLQRASSDGYEQDPRFLLVGERRGGLLLCVTQEQKAAMAAESVDWESSQSR